jgi:hypothetical protein
MLGRFQTFPAFSKRSENALAQRRWLRPSAADWQASGISSHTSAAPRVGRQNDAAVSPFKRRPLAGFLPGGRGLPVVRTGVVWSATACSGPNAFLCGAPASPFFLPAERVSIATGAFQPVFFSLRPFGASPFSFRRPCLRRICATVDWPALGFVGTTFTGERAELVAQQRAPSERPIAERFVARISCSSSLLAAAMNQKSSVGETARNWSSPEIVESGPPEIC